MTKQLDLGPKTREGHEEEHSRTSQWDAGAENTAHLWRHALLVYLIMAVNVNCHF